MIAPINFPEVPYHLYQTDGIIQLRSVLKEKLLETFQAHVGGYIEVVRLPNGMLAIVNEEGRIKGFKPNPSFPRLVGPVIVIAERDFE